MAHELKTVRVSRDGVEYDYKTLSADKIDWGVPEFKAGEGDIPNAWISKPKYTYPQGKLGFCVEGPLITAPFGLGDSEELKAVKEKREPDTSKLGKLSMGFRFKESNDEHQDFRNFTLEVFKTFVAHVNQVASKAGKEGLRGDPEMVTHQTQPYGIGYPIRYRKIDRMDDGTVMPGAEPGMYSGLMANTVFVIPSDPPKEIQRTELKGKKVTGYPQWYVDGYFGSNVTMRYKLKSMVITEIRDASDKSTDQASTIDRLRAEDPGGGSALEDQIAAMLAEKNISTEPPKAHSGAEDGGAYPKEPDLAESLKSPSVEPKTSAQNIATIF